MNHTEVIFQFVSGGQIRVSDMQTVTIQETNNGDWSIVSWHTRLEDGKKLDKQALVINNGIMREIVKVFSGKYTLVERKP